MANTKVTGDLIASLTIATGNIANNAITSDKISGLTTAHITEGANLYYTDARARAAVSVSGNALSYNSSTGVITSNFEESPTFTGNVLSSGLTVSSTLEAGNSLINTKNLNTGGTGTEQFYVAHSGSDLLLGNARGNLTFGTGSNKTTALTIGTSQNATFTGNVGIGVAAHGTASLNITNTDQHIRLNNGSELGIISLDTDGKLDLWAHGTDETINFRTGTGSGTVTMSVVGEKVGIGTTSPDYKLHIERTGDVMMQLKATDSNQAYMKLVNSTTGDGKFTDGLLFGLDNDESCVFWNYEATPLRFATSGTERMRIDSSGNVGIKITPSAWAADFSVIDMSLVGASIWASSYAANFGANIYQDTASTFKQSGGSYGVSYYSQFDGAHRFYGNTNQGANTSFVPTERMRINSSGSVGIGTTSPSDRLTVSGSGNFGIRIDNSGNTSSDYSAIRFHQNTAEKGVIYTNQEDLYLRSSSGDVLLQHSGGNVGIGTASPSAKLEVRGTAPTYTNSSTVFWGGTTNNDSHNGIMLSSYGDALGGSLASNLLYSNSNTPTQTNGNRSSGQIKFGNTTVASKTSDINFGGYYKGTTTFVERMRINGDGNVGIGTTSPTSKLHLRDPGTNSDVGIKIGNDSRDWNLKVMGSVSDSLQFFTHDNSNVMTILPSGNVGIGNANPQTNLTIGSAQGNSLEFTYDSTNGYRNIISNHWDSSTDTRMDFNIGRTGNVAPVPVMSVGYGGNVGIGTTSPSAKLTIDNGSASGGSLLKSSSASYTAHFIGNTGTGSAGIYMDAMDGDFIGSNYGFIGQNNAGYMEYNVSPSSPLPYHYFAQNIGIGTTSPSRELDIQASSGWAEIALRGNTGGGGSLQFWTTTTKRAEIFADTEDIVFRNTASNTERMRVTANGKTLIGTTSEQNAGRLQIDSGTSENGGILDIAGSGWYRYYTRVCRNATAVSAAGYWHIKTNIAVNSNVMFMAKFYGYIYGSAQILDLTHAGYAYSASNTVINQATTNNGSDPNASSAIYSSATGNKVTFRIAFGTGSNFSTYFAGVMMDMAFPSPAGQGQDFEIEAQSFSTSTTLY